MTGLLQDARSIKISGFIMQISRYMDVKCKYCYLSGNAATVTIIPEGGLFRVHNQSTDVGNKSKIHPLQQDSERHSTMFFRFVLKRHPNQVFSHLSFLFLLLFPLDLLLLFPPDFLRASHVLCNCSYLDLLA